MDNLKDVKEIESIRKNVRSIQDICETVLIQLRVMGQRLVPCLRKGWENIIYCQIKRKKYRLKRSTNVTIRL